MARHHYFVVPFFLFGIVGVHSRSQTTARTGVDELLADENFEYDQTLMKLHQYGPEGSRLLRAKRVVPEPHAPWRHPLHWEQEAAREQASMERQRMQREREASERRASEASRQLAAEERARWRGEMEQQYIIANGRRPGSSKIPNRRRSESPTMGNRRRSDSPIRANRQRSRSSLG